jgi:chromosome partitioning protein
MKAVAILNIKGGVGKSTIAFNLAHAIERHNRSVLLVDLDMQSNLTDMAVSQPERITYSVYDLMTDDTVLPPNCVYPTVIPNVDIIPADLRLFDIQQVLNPLSKPDALVVLQSRITGELDTYDYVVLDCRPEISLLTMNALLAATHYMIPVFCDRHSMRGIEMTDRYVASARKVNEDLAEIGVLVNNLDRRKTNAMAIYSALENRLGDRLMKTIIGTNAALETASTMQQTVFQYDRRAPGCRYFRELAKEVMTKCNDPIASESEEENEDDGGEG